VTEALSITGTGVGTNGALRNVSGNNTWGGTVTLTGASEIQSDAGTLTLSAANSITAGAAQTLTFDGLGNTTVNGTIVTPVSTLTRNRTGTLTLSGANTYTGLTSVNAGVLNIQNASALGAVGAGTTVLAGATLELQGPIAVGAEALTLSVHRRQRQRRVAQRQRHELLVGGDHTGECCAHQLRFEPVDAERRPYQRRVPVEVRRSRQYLIHHGGDYRRRRSDQGWPRPRCRWVLPIPIRVQPTSTQARWR